MAEGETGVKFTDVAGETMLGDISTPVMNREYSETTQTMIDEEITSIITERFTKVKELLEANKETLRKIAGRLLEREIIEAKEFQELIGK